MIKRQIILVLFSSLLLFSFTRDNEYKDNTSNSLFKIERSKDSNQIIYDLNKASEERLIKENPISIYWLRKTENYRIKPLTWIQQKYAYGLEYSFKNETSAKFHFVSYDKKDFILKKDVDGRFKVFTKMDNQYVVVKRIYIHLTGGSFWFPKIPKIELHVYNKRSNKDIVKIIIPS